MWYALVGIKISELASETQTDSEVEKKLWALSALRSGTRAALGELLKCSACCTACSCFYCMRVHMVKLARSLN